MTIEVPYHVCKSSRCSVKTCDCADLTQNSLVTSSNGICKLAKIACIFLRNCHQIGNIPLLEISYNFKGVMLICIMVLLYNVLIKGHIFSLKASTCR